MKVYVRDSLKVEAERIESEALTFEDRARIEIFCTLHLAKNIEKSGGIQSFVLKKKKNTCLIF